jgi:hypothetical protein
MYSLPPLLRCGFARNVFKSFTLKILLFLFFLFLLSCNSGSNSKTTSTDTSNVIPGSLADTLLNLQKLEEKAEQEKDFTTLDRLLSPDFSMTRLDGEVWTREQLYEDIRSTSSDYYYSPKYDSVKVATEKDTAYMNYKISFSNQGANAMDTVKYDMSTIWLRKDTSWMIFRMSVGRGK